jgi:hypothetical protein
MGRRAAVAEIQVPLLGKRRLSGYPAWLFWLFVHIYFLIGFRNRVVALADWMSAYWTARRSARVIATAPLIREQRFEASGYESLSRRRRMTEAGSAGTMLATKRADAGAG